MIHFNGIRYDTKYDYLLVFGIAPSALYFDTYPRNKLTELNMVPMAKNTNNSFKHTIRPSRLRPIKDLQNHLNALGKR